MNETNNMTPDANPNIDPIVLSFGFPINKTIIPPKVSSSNVNAVYKCIPKPVDKPLISAKIIADICFDSMIASNIFENWLAG